MVTRSRLRKKGSSKRKNRMKKVVSGFIRVTKGSDEPRRSGEVDLKERKLWAIKGKDDNTSVGFYGKPVMEDFSTFSSKPPYIRIFLPETDSKYVKIDWKKGKLYDLFTGDYFGKIPKSAELESYVPVKLTDKGHPQTILEEEVARIKKESKEAKSKREIRKILKEENIPIIETKGIQERIKEGTYP